MIQVFVLLVCLLCAASGADSAESTPSVSPRHEYTNVILVSLQCLRADHLGAYGYKRGTSPNIDRLAKQSVLFENAISQANLTPVAQMSVLTSQYPRVNGMVSFEVTRDMVASRTLPDILKYYGYTNAATISSPEFFMRFNTESGTMVNPGDVFSRSFDYFGRTARGPRGASLRTLPSDAFQWLQQNKDKKFFLWIGSGLIHMPYAAAVPAPYKTMYDTPDYIPFWKRLPVKDEVISSIADPSYEVFSRVHKNDFFWNFAPVYRLTQEDVNYVTGRYDAGVYYTDLFIGELMKQLDELKLTENTVVILQSMHGEDLGEQGDFFHYDVSDAVMKNALIMRFPNDEYAGRRVSEQVQGIDIMPTVLNYLGIPVNHEAQGDSMLPLIKGEKDALTREFTFIDRLPWWEFILSKWYLEFQNAQGVQFAPAEKGRLDEYQKMLQVKFDELGYPPGDIAIRSNQWKLIVRKNKELLEKVSWWGFITGKKQHVEELELYDLKNDPGEKKNVAQHHPQVVARLKKKLLEWDESIQKQTATYNQHDKRLIIPYP